MIDLHCHILPGVDDGARSLEESLTMAEKAVSQGITHILCTPHHMNGKYKTPKQLIYREVDFLQKELDERNIPLTLFEGQEIRIYKELIDDLGTNTLQFIDENDRYLLIEFPSNDIPGFSKKVLTELIRRGKVPIIVHPERNAKFIEKPRLLAEYLDLGCLAQLTAPSYVGVFGSKIQKTARYMVENQLVQMVASDAHGVSRRDFYLREAFEAIIADFGPSFAKRMDEVSRSIVNGDDVLYPPHKAMRKKVFGIF